MFSGPWIIAGAGHHKLCDRNLKLISISATQPSRSYLLMRRLALAVLADFCFITSPLTSELYPMTDVGIVFVLKTRLLACRLMEDEILLLDDLLAAGRYRWGGRC